MKILKKILLLSLTLLTLCIGIIDANAFAKDEVFKRTGKKNASVNLYFIDNGERWSYSSSIYTAEYTIDHQSYDIYCMDPGYAHGDGDNFIVNSVFMEDTSKANEEYGLAKIITTMPSDDSEFQTTGDLFSYAKGFALRIFWDGHTNRAYKSKRDIAMNALSALAESFAKDGVYADPNHIIPHSNLSDSAKADAEKVIHDAAILYRIGLKAEESYTDDMLAHVETSVVDVLGATEEGTGDPFYLNQSTPENPSDEPDQITKNVIQKKIVTLKLTNFDASEGSFIFNSFDNSNFGNYTSTIVGISTESSNNFDDYSTPITYGTNVFETFSDAVTTDSNGKKNLTLYIAIEIKGTIIIESASEEEECDECEDVKAMLSYVYRDPSALIGAELMHSGKKSGNYQRFLVASKTQRENSGNIEIPMKNCTKMCSNTCSPIVCEGDICYPDSTLPQICKDGLTPDKDGLVEYKFLEGYIEGEGFNIKKCLLGAQADAANNSYKLIDEKNANAVADNPYCSILCREQYSIRVPYKQTVEEGRYFKITLSMKGQQDCYSTRFDDALFNEKVEETENKIIEAINKFNVFNVLANLDFDTDLQASNVLYCNKASCTVNLTASGCTKGSYTSTEDAWKVIQYDVISKNVIQFYKNLNGDIGSTSQSLESLIQKYNNDDRDDYELLLRYGIMGDQTEGSVSCNFKDEGTHYTTSFTSGSLTITRSGTRFNYRLDNSGNDDEISLSYIIRGYSSDGSLLFKTNLNVSAESDSVESGTVQGQGSISYFTVAPASRDNNISCELSDNQEVCKKTEAEDHFNSKIKDYKTYLKAAQKDVIDLVEELKKTIDQYNSCVGDKNYETLSEGYQDSAFWNMVYKYDPEIKYSYDEPDPTNPSRHKWIGDVQNTSCGDGNCDIMFAKNEEVKAEDCAEDSSVKCTSLGSEGKIESLFSGEEQYVNTYCTGEINDDYSCKSGELHTLDDSTYDNYDFFMCKYNESTAQFDCGSESHPVTKVKYIHKAAVGSGDYDTRLVYYTEHGTGEIKIQYLEDPTLNKNYSQVPGVPVSADTPQGTYIYILNIQNVGTFYNSGELGRIYSSKSNSLSTYARNLQGSSASYPITSGVGSDASDTDKEIAINEYACTYAVSQSSCVDKDGNTRTIDECDIGGKHANWEECKKDICPPSDTGESYCVKEAGAYYVCSSTSYDADKCEKAGSRAEALSKSTVNENCCPNCRAVCVGKCIYVLKNNRTNDGKVQFEFRTVTPQNMNPNDRRLGYNWDSKNSNTLVAQKASNTIAEIEARSGGKDNENVNIADIPDYVLHVVMTPDMVTWIKEYNNEQQSQGAYSNKSLTCYNYDLDDITDEKTCKGNGYIWQEGASGEDGKCVMSNVFCYSNFIDELEEKFPNQFDAPHRTEAKNNASSNFETYTGLLNHGDNQIITNDYWTIYKYDTLDINGDGVPDIGPSWK